MNYTDAVGREWTIRTDRPLCLTVRDGEIVALLPVTDGPRNSDRRVRVSVGVGATLAAEGRMAIEVLDRDGITTICPGRRP